MGNRDQKASRRRWFPSADTIRYHPSLKFLGSRIQDPNLWHIRRYSISMGVFIGLFFCFMPMPFQMLCGAIFALLLRANLWCSVGLVWVSNPITMGPMMIFAYKIGRRVLNTSALYEGHLTWHKLFHDLTYVWKPLWIGCIICGLILGVIGVILVQLCWKMIHRRFHIKPR